jgi:hypothetical protein
MNVVTDYLRLPKAYREFLGGVRWSGTDDALVFADGQTFAFNEQVAQFLVGFSSGGRLIHFGHMVHLLKLLRPDRMASLAEAARLRRAYDDARSSLHNAGALCAVLCRDIPAVASPVTVQDVCDRLRNTSMPMRWYLGLFHLDAAEQPPLGPEEFEQRLLAATRAYSDEELLTWFRHGRGPVKEAAEALARELPRPRHLAGVLTALLERPRLAAAAGFVSQLVGALTLPPRRLERQELAVGGYTDVTTHGHLDEILPSQFALDEWDFFRRFAENELLYFRREDPPSRTRQELVVVFDQGVRTWGDVRLVLSAAVLALGKQAARRGVPFLVAGTANDGKLLDPLEADADELGELIEASDLSPHPGLALERVLEGQADGSRDVVLLTHPRNLAEADVVSAARRAAAPAVRLFALALDASGAAALSELKSGLPVKVREFRVDFTPSAPRPVPVPDSMSTAPVPWQGDVEQIGFPFHFSVAGGLVPGMSCFDYEGRWLVAGANRGLFYVWKADGTESEFLPRALVNGRVFDSPDGVLGVAGGVAVLGRDGKQLVVVHYDLTRRICTCYRPDVRIEYAWSSCYSPRHHAVVVHSNSGGLGCALDLATGAWHLSLVPGEDSRAREAWVAWVNGELAERTVCVRSRNGQAPELTRDCHYTAASELAPPVCHFDARTGQVALRGATPPWHPFTPRGDGRPVLEGMTIHQAQCRGSTLALLCSSPGGQKPTLRLFRGPDGTPVCELPMEGVEYSFVLTEDGERFARQVSPSRMEIRDLSGAVIQRPRLRPDSGPVELLLGEDCLVLLTPRREQHILRWGRGRLELEFEVLNAGGHVRPGLSVSHTRWPGTPEGVPAFLKGDPNRFLAGAQGQVLAVVDRHGQVAILAQTQRLVCMFFVLRATVAGWMPNGTRFGPESVTGAPATAGAMEKFGRALCTASGTCK